MKANWGGNIDERKWGVGQVLALFAWAPWMIEAFSEVELARIWLQGEGEQSHSPAMEDTAMGQLA